MLLTGTQGFQGRGPRDIGVLYLRGWPDEGVRKPPSTTVRTTKEVEWDTEHSSDFLFDPGLLNRKLLKRSKLGSHEGNWCLLMVTDVSLLPGM